MLTTCVGRTASLLCSFVVHATLYVEPHRGVYIYTGAILPVPLLGLFPLP